MKNINISLFQVVLYNVIEYGNIKNENNMKQKRTADTLKKLTENKKLHQGSFN